MEVLIDGCRYLPAFRLDRKRTRCSLGHTLANYRRVNNLSLAQVAERAGVSKTYLWEIESNRARDPSFSIVCRLARVYGVDLNLLDSGGTR